MPKRKVQSNLKNFVKSKKDANEKEKVETPVKKSKVDTTKEEKIPMNRTNSDFGSLNYDCVKLSSNGQKWNLKISSWNVVSLKSIVKKNGFDFIDYEKPDIFCLQETKCDEKGVPTEAKVDGYHRYFVASEKPGYAGVAVYSKVKPIKVDYGIGIKEHDKEGRLITAEYEKFYLVTAYVPNAGRGLVTLPKRMKWDPDFREYLKNLDSKKPVVLCGDLNVAHKEIDLKNPATNHKTAGFTPEERQGMTDLLDAGFVDSFRHLYPDKESAYTYWSYLGNARTRNVGWRLDYFVVSSRLVPQICDNVIRSEVFGSDHCPVTLFLNV